MGGNPFAEEYQRLREEVGLSPRNARRVVARHLAATLWGMWKSGSDYRPELVSQAALQKAARVETGRRCPARGRDQRPQFPPPDPHPLPSSLLFQEKPMQR